jgi:hypothetical protein
VLDAGLQRASATGTTHPFQVLAPAARADPGEDGAQPVDQVVQVLRSRKKAIKSESGWSTYTAAAGEAGLSCEYGGIHFRDADAHGRNLGRAVGTNIWKGPDLLPKASPPADPPLAGIQAACHARPVARSRASRTKRSCG